MFAMVGLAVVVVSVLGGFAIAGGHPAALFHISEIVVIVGTAAGTLLVSTPPRVVRAMVAKARGVMRPSPFSRQLYLEALKLLYEMFQVARKDGLVAIESHIEGPAQSALFRKYPSVVRHHHAIEFLCDSLRLVLVGSVPPFDLESLLDAEIEVHHEAESRPAVALQKVGDSLPGIGIVAAVLGIVVTMEAIAGPVEEIGEKVGAALTGTFLGVLLAYGFLNPLSAGIEHHNAAESRFYHFLKAGIVSFAKGSSPIVAVEFARRSIYAEARPSFLEMEKACKGVKASS